MSVHHPAYAPFDVELDHANGARCAILADKRTEITDHEWRQLFSINALERCKANLSIHRRLASAPSPKPPCPSWLRRHLRPL